MSTLYESDIHAWSVSQIKVLKSIDKYKINLDIQHLIEELESMGSSERNEIWSHMVNIIFHMLKQKNQSNDNNTNKSWKDSIENAQDQIYFRIQKTPSLKNYPEEILEQCFNVARNRYCIKFNKDKYIFEKECPWTLNEILGE